MTQLDPDLLAEVLDELDSFTDRVYWLVQQVPPGRVVTYGQIALYAGSAGAARAVGNLMRESFGRGVEVPWQRVINSRGGISYRGDFGRGELQRRLLESEGIVFDRNGHCDLEAYRWQPDTVFWEERQ